MFVTRLATAAILLAACIAAMFLLPTAWWALLLARGAARRRLRVGRARGLRPRRARGVLLRSARVRGCARDFSRGRHQARRVEPAIYGASCSLLAARRAALACPRLARSRPARRGGWLARPRSGVARARAAAGRSRGPAASCWASSGSPTRAAYLAGRPWGSHKLAPRISPARPGKAWPAPWPRWQCIMSCCPPSRPARSWAGGWRGRARVRRRCWR